MTQDMKPQDVTPQTLSSQVKTGTTGSLVLGVLMIVLGFAAISLPLATSLAFAFWIGWLLVGNSIVTLIYAVQTRQEGGFILKLLLFALYLGAGLLLIINPLEGVLTLTLLLGGFLIAEGVSELLLAFQLRSLSSNWRWVLLNAIVTLLIGIVILAEWPLNSPWVVGTLVGVSFITSGFSRVMLSLAIRNALGTLSESAQ